MITFIAKFGNRLIILSHVWLWIWSIVELIHVSKRAPDNKFRLDGIETDVKSVDFFPSRSQRDVQSRLSLQAVILQKYKTKAMRLWRGVYKLYRDCEIQWNLSITTT